MDEVLAVVVIPLALTLFGLFVEYWIVPWLLKRTGKMKPGSAPDYYTIYKSIRERRIPKDHSKVRDAYYFILILLIGASSGVGSSAIVASFDSPDAFSVLIFPALILGGIAACIAEYLFETGDSPILFRLPLAAFWGFVGGFIGVAVVYAIILFLFFLIIYWLFFSVSFVQSGAKS